MTARDLLVYVNVPFCTQKCHFCDWVQPIPTADLRLPAGSSRWVSYVQALQTQIGCHTPALRAAGYVPRILYFGGGTATMLTPPDIRAIMGALGELVDLTEIDEATIEGSPETITEEKLDTFLEVGFNRISIGLQSMNDERLRRLARPHDSARGAWSVRAARRAGFRDISIDLISGLPGESLAEFERSLRAALDLPFDHVSLYPYRPASGTVLRGQMRRGDQQIDLEEQLAAYQLAADRLTGAGFEEYCFGHFGSPKSRSDLAYFGIQMDWVGFGSGASSLFQGHVRKNEKGFLDRFIANPTSFDLEMPATAPLVTRHLLYEALSTPQGARADAWQERTGGTLTDALRQTPAVLLIEYFRRQTGVIIDPEGVRLPPAKIPAAYIKLLHLNAPQKGRRRVEASSLTGGS